MKKKGVFFFLFAMVNYANAQITQSTTTFGTLNYPTLVTQTDKNKLPKGSWYYSFCTFTEHDSVNQVLFVLDNNCRAVYTQSIAPWNLSWPGFVVSYQSRYGLLGYSNSYFYYPHGISGQASGIFARFKADTSRKGLVPYDTLWGTGTYNHAAPTLDPHGIYLGDSFYVCMQRYSLYGDTGFGIAMMSYKGEPIAVWSSKDSVNGIPYGQSYRQSCSPFSVLPANDVDHANSICSIGDSVFLVSMRHQKEVVCLKYNKQLRYFTREWRLRPPKDLYSSFKWTNDSIGFSGQHNIKVVRTEKNKLYVTLFDNANCNSSQQSRFLLLKLDLDSMTCCVLRTQPLGFYAVSQGSSMLINNSSKLIDLINAPILYSTGTFDTSFIQQQGVNIIGITNFKGKKIAGIRFQKDTIKALYQVRDRVYQASALYIPLFDTLKPQITTICCADSMELILDEHYDNMVWESGETSQTISLPKSDKVISVMVKNKGTVGEWWAYSEGCPVSKRKSKLIRGSVN